MKPHASALLLVAISSLAAPSQVPAPVDKDAFAQHANSLYYRPVEQGLISFTRRVKVDWDTVPNPVLLPAEIAGRRPLEETKLFVTVHASGANSLRHEYTQGAPTWMRPAYDKVFELLSSLVSGFLQTWGTKYLHGPMPEGRFLTGVENNGDGYLVMASNAPAQFKFSLSSDYRMREMVTKAPNDDIDEHTGFSDSPRGWVITSNEGVDQTKQETTHMKYEMTYQTTDGFLVPNAVRLMVNDNINMKFSFENCSVQKGIVLKVAPPRHH